MLRFALGNLAIGWRIGSRSMNHGYLASEDTGKACIHRAGVPHGRRRSVMLGIQEQSHTWSAITCYWLMLLPYEYTKTSIRWQPESKDCHFGFDAIFVTQHSLVYWVMFSRKEKKKSKEIFLFFWSSLPLFLFWEKKKGVLRPISRYHKIIWYDLM